MELTNVVSMEEAQRIIKRLAKSSRNKPFIVGVYGIPDHGKSFFMRGFFQRNYIQRKPHAIKLAQGVEEADLEELDHFDEAEFFLVHIPISYPSRDLVEGANIQLRNAKNRSYDLNVLLLNPEMLGCDIEKCGVECRKNYDLVVLNHGSKTKGLCPRQALQSP